MGNVNTESNSKLEIQYIQTGQKYLEKRDYLRALQFFENCKNLQPENQRILVLKGLALLNLEQIDDAFQCINTALELEPNNAEFHQIKGQSLIQIKEYKEAIFCLEECIRINPKMHEGYFHLAFAYQKFNQFFTSLKYIETQVSLNSESAKGQQWKGINLYNLKKYNETANALTKCLSINDKYPSAHQIIGECMKNEFKQNEALENQVESIKLFPNHLDSQCGLAESQSMINLKEDAQQFFKYVLEINPEYERAIIGIENL